MSRYLFKPHVEGPEGAITTPAIIVDRRLMSTGKGVQARDVNCLRTDAWQQLAGSTSVLR